MQSNGKTLNMNDIFSKELIDNLPDEMPEQVTFDIKQSNIIANIPSRFSESRFGEFDYPFFRN